MKEKQSGLDDGILSATGKRKTSVARVRLVKGGNESPLFVVNGKNIEEYFSKNWKQIHAAKQSLALFSEILDKYTVYVNVFGGGITGQSEAIRHGISRAVSGLSKEHRSTCKSHGFLTCDNRKVERKKYGQPKARKKFQYSKR